MNYVTTNIRFPEDLYMELKMEAAKTRKSIAAIVREKVAPKTRVKKPNTEKLMREMDELAKKMAKYTKGVSLSKALIEMRYEQ